MSTLCDTEAFPTHPDWGIRVRPLAILALALAALGVAGCGLPLPGLPAAQSTIPAPAAPPATTTQAPVATAMADRAVCVDLDARGGALYNVLIIPMMTGSTGPKSVDVNIAQLNRAVQLVRDVGKGQIDQASPPISDEARRLAAAADAFTPYEHAESTALLTSFVGLSVECQKAGYKPSWFDAAKLQSLGR